MAPLITAAALTVALLVGLWVLIYVGWWLLLRFIDPLLERSRASVQQERIIKSHHQLLERHRQERARQLARKRHRVVDLNGQVCWLLPDELRGFLRSCWVELELAEGSAWSVVRQHWRRSSLRWHPDHGGDPVVWLRKQRAYEALKRARSQANEGHALRPGPAPTAGRPAQTLALALALAAQADPAGRSLNQTMTAVAVGQSEARGGGSSWTMPAVRRGGDAPDLMR